MEGNEDRDWPKYVPVQTVRIFLLRSAHTLSLIRSYIICERIEDTPSFKVLLQELGNHQTLIDCSFLMWSASGPGNEPSWALPHDSDSDPRLKGSAMESQKTAPCSSRNAQSYYL